MAITLYDATVPSFLQVLGGLRGVLEKGLAHAGSAGLDPQTLVDTRLAADMLPLSFQVESVAHHSVGALEGLKSGAFGPPAMQSTRDYAALQQLVAEAEAKVSGWSREAVNALAGREVAFTVAGNRVPFEAEDFLFSFSLPNLYFHATTAYDILRMKGVPLSKRDYLGRMRVKA